MTHLLDGNVLVALAMGNHVHHDLANGWFGSGRAFATCPRTQGTLLRVLLLHETHTTDAVRALGTFTSRADHEFWPGDLCYSEINLRGVIGHRQVTDAYLAGLARARGGRLATFDRGLAALHSDVADLVGAT